MNCALWTKTLCHHPDTLGAQSHFDRLEFSEAEFDLSANEFVGDLYALNQLRVEEGSDE